MVEVHRHQRLGVVAQDALQLALGGRLENAVDLVHGGRPGRREGQVYHRDVNRRDAHGKAVQLPIEFREHQADGGGGPGLRGNHRHGGRTGPPQILVIHVGQDLIIGVRVNRSHQTLNQTQLLVQGLDERRQTIGRAGGIRDDGVGALQRLVIHAVHDGGIHVLAARRGDDHFLRPGLEMSRRLFLGRKEARALQNNVYTELSPGQFRRIALGEHTDPVAVHHHAVAIDSHGPGKLAVGRIVPRQVGVGIGVTQVIDRHDGDLASAPGLVEGAKNIAADMAVTIDGNFDGHANDS